MAAYLEQTEAFDEIFLMLFSHGVDSAGLAPITRWRQLLERAKKRGDFIGVEEQAYPRDFATFIRYDTALNATVQRKTRKRGQLSSDSLNRFFSQGPAPRERMKMELLN